MFVWACCIARASALADGLNKTQVHCHGRRAGQGQSRGHLTFFFQTSNQTHTHTFSYLFSRIWLNSFVFRLVFAKSSPDHFFLSSISFSAAPAHRAPDATRSNLTRVATPDDNVLVGPFTSKHSLNSTVQAMFLSWGSTWGPHTPEKNYQRHGSNVADLPCAGVTVVHSATSLSYVEKKTVGLLCRVSLRRTARTSIFLPGLDLTHTARTIFFTWI